LTRKANAIPGGGGNYGYDRGASGGKEPKPAEANRAKRQANARVFGTNAAAVGNGRMTDQVFAPRSNLTWVGGNRNAEDLDETSQ
jgi:hypothetical protein